MSKKSSPSTISILNRRVFLEYLSVLGISTAVLPGCTVDDAGDEGITIESLEAAEKIAGIELSNSERKDILNGVVQNLEKYHGFSQFCHLGH